MLPFSAENDLVEARALLRASAEEVLAKLSAGVRPTDAERESVDCKEEAGRRGAGGILLPGQPTNLAAAEQLAPEVAAMANTPGGGVLIIGVEDSSGALLGAGLDAEWLRHRVYERVDVAPLVEERVVDGVRLLLVFVAEAREPVEGPDNKLRWRTGGHSVPVDRAEWWLRRQDRTGADAMAAITARTAADVSPGALLVARRYLGAGVTDPESGPPDGGPEPLLRWLGVLRPDGYLTQAGALMFCSNDRTVIAMSVFDVEGGDVLAAPPDLAGQSLLEQVATVESRLDTLNTAATVTPSKASFAENPARQLPPRAVREAVLNAATHRDWMQTDPVSVTWIQSDSALEVVSPGGFSGGVSPANALTQRYARYPALADLFRALRLVDKNGMGVDRMVREMISLGHRPPVLAEDPGPRVRVRLHGGRPVIPVTDLMRRIRPEVRQRDVRVALIVSALLHSPFVTPTGLRDLLQRNDEECLEAIEATADCRVGTEPLLVPYKDVWRLSPGALRVVEGTGTDRLTELKRRGVLLYRRPDSAAAVADAWLEIHERITTGDHAILSGLSQPGALNQLDRLVRSGALVRGDQMGRNAHYSRTVPS